VFLLVISIGLDLSQHQSHEICTYLWWREKRETLVILVHLRAVNTCQARELIIKSGVSRYDIGQERCLISHTCSSDLL